jgi:arylsulfate sulfotransferase
MNRIHWLPKWLNETFALVVIPAFFVVLIITGLMIYGFQKPGMEDVESLDLLTDRQYDTNLLLMDTILDGEYGESNPLFVLNPFEISPLSGLLLFETDTITSYIVEIEGKTEDMTVSYETDAKTTHFIPVYGLYPDYQNTIKIYTNHNHKKGDLITTLTVVTDPLPDTVNVPTSIDTTYDYFGTDWMLLTPATSTLPVAIDAYGEVRWYSTTPLAFAMKQLDNGHYLVGGNRIMSTPYYTTSLWEMDLLGKIYVEYQLPGGYHHDFVELPDGNLLVATNDFEGTVEDVIVELDRTTGLIVDTWDIADYISKTDGMSQMWTATDWFHNNSVDYDPTTDAILVSGRHQDVVLNIGKTSHALNYIIGDPEEWDETTVSDYFLSPIGDEFEWSYAQHSAIFLPNGDVFLFDNGNNRAKNSDDYITANNNYSRGVIYHIDETNRTIEQVYEYGSIRNNDFYSPYISNVDYYDDGNYLIHSGGIGQTIEGSLNIPAPLYEGDFEVTTKSITVEVLDDEVAYELEMPDNYYRAVRIDPYSDVYFETDYRHEKGEQLITEQYTGDIRRRITILQTLPPKYEMTFVKETDRLVVSGLFTQGDSIYLELRQGETSIYYHIPSSNTAYTAMCTAIFEDDSRAITYYVNERNISGLYDIYVIINGHRYDTYLQVSFK